MTALVVLPIFVDPAPQGVPLVMILDADPKVFGMQCLGNKLFLVQILGGGMDVGSLGGGRRNSGFSLSGSWVTPLSMLRRESRFDVAIPYLHPLLK